MEARNESQIIVPQAHTEGRDDSIHSESQFGVGSPRKDNFTGLTTYDPNNKNLLQNQIVNEYREFKEEHASFVSGLKVVENPRLGKFYAGIKSQQEIHRSKARTATGSKRGQPTTYDIKIRSYNYRGVPD